MHVYRRFAKKSHERGYLKREQPFSELKFSTFLVLVVVGLKFISQNCSTFGRIVVTICRSDLIYFY